VSYSEKVVIVCGKCFLSGVFIYNKFTKYESLRKFSRKNHLSTVSCERTVNRKMKRFRYQVQC
jgi:hypothetical protein